MNKKKGECAGLVFSKWLSSMPKTKPIASKVRWVLFFQACTVHSPGDQWEENPAAELFFSPSSY